MEETIYTFILIKKDGTYLGWSKAIEMPPCGEPKNMEWIKWGKELPDDIDDKAYRYEKGELTVV